MRKKRVPKNLLEFLALAGTAIALIGAGLGSAKIVALGLGLTLVCLAARTTGKWPNFWDRFGRHL